MTTVTYELKKCFDYAHAGKLEAAQFIEISEPAAKHMEYTAPIRQALMRAIAEAQRNSSESESSDDGGEIDGSTLIAILESSSEPFGKLLAQFKLTAIRSKLFKVDGSELLTGTLFDQLSTEDLYSLFGEFLRAFIAASLLK